MSSSQAQFIIEAASRYQGTDRHDFVGAVKTIATQADKSEKGELDFGSGDVVVLASFFVQVASFAYDLYRDNKSKDQIRKLVREEVGPVVERKGIPQTEFDNMVGACVDTLPTRTDEHLTS